MPALILPQSIWQDLQNHLDAWLPMEGCAMLAGRDRRASLLLPLANQARSPVRYTVDPVELLAALETVDTHGLEILAIAHSHPHGPAIPSTSDLVEWHYGKTGCLICTKSATGWNAHLFRIDQNRYTALEVVIPPEAQNEPSG